jgi:hypothetical protein
VSGYGHYVVIELLGVVHPTTGRNIRLGFAHLDSIPNNIRNGVGVTFDAGVVIGTVGNTGTGGVHLHLEAITNGGTSANQTNYNNTVNPLQFFPQVRFRGVVTNGPEQRTHRRNQTNVPWETKFCNTRNHIIYVNGTFNFVAHP